LANVLVLNVWCGVPGALLDVSVGLREVPVVRCRLLRAVRDVRGLRRGLRFLSRRVWWRQVRVDRELRDLRAGLQRVRRRLRW